MIGTRGVRFGAAGASGAYRVNVNPAIRRRCIEGPELFPLENIGSALTWDTVWYVVREKGFEKRTAAHGNYQAPERAQNAGRPQLMDNKLHCVVIKVRMIRSDFARFPCFQRTGPLRISHPSSESQRNNGLD